MALSDHYISQLAAAIDYAGNGPGSETVTVIAPNGERRTWHVQLSEGVDDVGVVDDGQIGIAGRVFARRPISVSGSKAEAGAIEEKRTLIERSDGLRWTVARLLREEGDVVSLWAV